MKGLRWVPGLNLLDERLTSAHCSNYTQNMLFDILSVTFMLEDVSVVLLALPFVTRRFGGDFSGEEKRPSNFSIPCSSRAFS